MSSLEVKNLSIAAEALSRIPGYDAENLRQRILNLIDTKLKPMEHPPQRPESIDPDEQIPF